MSSADHTIAWFYFTSFYSINLREFPFYPRFHVMGYIRGKMREGNTDVFVDTVCAVVFVA
jgi:hypothetical protein